MGPDEYLENALKPLDQASVEKNKVRDRLRALFKHRGCMTMVRPCDDEQALKTLNDLPDTAMKAVFLEQAAALRALVLQRTQPAQVQGMTMTGPLLVRLARLYVKAINEGAAPAIKDSWSLISADECQRAMVQAEQEFLKVLAEARVDGSALDRQHERKPVAASVLEHAFTQGFEKALALYKVRAMGDCTEEFRERLREMLRTRANKLRAENIQIIARKAEAVVDQFELGLMENRSFEDMRAAFGHAETSYYRDVGVDPGSRAAWCECVAKRVWEWAGRYFAKQTTDLVQAHAQLPLLQQQTQAYQQATLMATERAEQAERTLADAELAAADNEQRIRALETELQQALEDYERSAMSDRSAQATQQESLSAAQSELSRVQQQALASESKLAEVLHALAENEIKLANLQAEYAAVSELRAEAATWEQKFQQADTSRLLACRRVTELTAHLNKAAGDHERELQQLTANTSEVITQLSRAKDDAVEHTRVAERAQREQATALEQLRREAASKDSVIQRLEGEMATQRKTQQEERAEHKAELLEVRGEASRNAKQFQRQLEEQAAQNRDEARKRAAKMRDEVEKLFQEKVTAAGRAQQMETRAQQAEESLRELQLALHQERERSRELNLAGKLAMLEAAAGTAQARYDMLHATLQEKNDIVAEQQSQITDLEAELRQIQQRHEAEKLRLQLDFARKLGTAH